VASDQAPRRVRIWRPHIPTRRVRYRRHGAGAPRQRVWLRSSLVAARSLHRPRRADRPLALVVLDEQRELIKRGAAGARGVLERSVPRRPEAAATARSQCRRRVVRRRCACARPTCHRGLSAGVVVLMWRRQQRSAAPERAPTGSAVSTAAPDDPVVATCRDAIRHQLAGFELIAATESEPAPPFDTQGVDQPGTICAASGPRGALAWIIRRRDGRVLQYTEDPDSGQPVLRSFTWASSE
jgi:hypothetical protein